MDGNARALPIRLSYCDNHHMSQIYAGFQMLESAGVLKCHWEPGPPGCMPNFVSVTVGDAVRVHYDVSDGLNWIPGDEAANLDYFAANAPAGVIFKRSYCEAVRARAGTGTTVLPLGLNYHITPNYHPNKGTLKDRLERQVRDTPFFARALKIQSSTFTCADYEALPQLNGPAKVMLFTRLWDPRGEDVRSKAESDERTLMNAARIELISNLRRTFAGRFFGGLYTDAYSSENAPQELLLPWAATEKRTYLRRMKEHAVCVATTGLHGSTGWRLAEYVAASRAIVTEPLRFDPGTGLVAGRNYVEASPDLMQQEVESLLVNPHRIRGMMLANFHHYRSRLRPDALILATLERALANTIG